MARRVIAQRIKTGQFLSWSVPLADATSTRELSGPGGITGILRPKDRYLMGDDGQPIFREWSTALYFEADGEIRGGGIVDRIQEDAEGKLRLEAPGFSTYPNGIPYDDTYRPGLGADPLDVVREIWRHLQSYPDGDLGMVIDSTTSDAVLDDVSGDDPKPYKLSWWDAKDCGAEINTMLDAAPADYIETHFWSPDHSEVRHRLELGVPRLGKKRHDLRFAEGENIVEAVPLLIDGDDFAQNVLALGRGEGRKMVRDLIATRDDRLRRVAVVADKAANRRQAERLARTVLHQRNDTMGYDQVVVRDHPNARLSDIHPGDDILVQARHTWYGRTRLWVRVISIEESLDSDRLAALNVARSDQFRI